MSSTRLTRSIQNVAYRLVPESAAAKGERRRAEPGAVDAPAALVSRLLRGIYF